MLSKLFARGLEAFHDLVVELALPLAAGGGEEHVSSLGKSAVQETHGDEHGIGPAGSRGPSTTAAVCRRRALPPRPVGPIRSWLRCGPIVLVPCSLAVPPGPTAAYRGPFGGRLVAVWRKPSVPEQCSENVDAPAGEGDHGLDELAAVASLLQVVVPVEAFADDAGLGQQVEDTAQASAVELGAVEVAGASTTVPGNRHKASGGCEVADVGVRGQVARGDDELGTLNRTPARQGLQ